MKLIVAIIKPFKLDEVRDALHKIDVHGLTVSEVKGHGRQKGQQEIYRGAPYVVNFLPKIQIEILTVDERLEATIEAISSAADSGKIGDGKIFVMPVDEAIRIRTRERGDAAV